DEAAISGESIPVEKRLGSEVFGGTINLGQPLYIEVTQTSENTRFAKIIQLVEEAQQMPSQTATLIEKIERIYVPIVLIAVPLMIVLCTFFTNWGFQESFYRGMVLLVVASPCALVASATPATLAAISHAARLGVLCKGGQALDAFANVKAIAFDKTGTLTRGKPAVTDVHLLLDEPFIPQLIVGMEKQSNHPLAEAILAYFHDERPLELAVEEQAGVGLAATYQAAHWTIGKEVDLTSVAVSEQTRIHELKAAGKTLIYINRDRVLAGYLALLDQPRPEARESLAYFNEQGIHTTMLTGDHLGTAKVIAAEIGLSDYESDCLPDEKTTRIKEMKETYKINAMVGDGINDAPALATASVGIAMGEGTDVAMDVADIVLMKNDLLRLVDSHRLAKKLQRIIKQNIVFSISVILLLIASNFLEFLTLPLGVVGHEGSTILVILNGLRMLLPLHKETPHQAKPTRKDCDDCVLYQQSLHT
ncbi:heavy metal translocating P-type ATPase, partial [Listeria monocytogenes]|nr:heavy metal translocating P-type ATPase [Listeria monocytogenes]